MEQYKAAVATLGGMNEQTLVVDVDKCRYLHMNTSLLAFTSSKDMCVHVANKVMKYAALHYVGTQLMGDQSEMLFAAQLSGDDDVYVSVTVTNGSKSVKIVIKSEQTMFSMQFIEFLKKIMK